ncbi:MAG: phage major capsid protein [Staphylococcus warneri]|uniref:phage major capsid protein n=1 Tax=Staphylococcus warneri TaxID=1292 RepID=UPI0009A509E0|nr:phage major capsid protein [Staphylococcus warneri]MCM3482254.1 phage major capsid protein [Staphylococcus warneri]MCT1632264.1 phage major capsid protein [Staphylococcus warneri]MCT2348259.1 phage major capsid protein [Staphylococcus warneri]MCV7476667.1 phage major capsid protein [Staphylococcus warneri]MDK8516438.1 phage major capsid protein [Staphylococcus warneri]
MAEVQNQKDDLKSSIQELINEAKQALADNDIEKAKQLQSEIESSKQSLEELEKVSDQLDQYESELGTKEDAKVADESTEQPTETPKKEEQPEKTEETNQPKEDSETESPADKKVEDVEEPNQKDLDSEKKKGAKRMRIKNEQETNEAVQGFAEYMKSKGAKRDNVKSDDVGVTIPEDIKYQPEKEVKTVQDLSELVQKTKVTTASGRYPILKRANAKFNTVAELEKNPELARPEFETINWEVETYRGAIPISQEALDDSVANLTQIVSENINEQKINTLNEKIGTVLKAFNPTTVSNVDDLKAIINVKLDPGYDRQIICTQSFYQAVDTLKDKNDRYLLNDSIINTSGNTLLGMNVTVVRDDLLGKNGDALAFIGDVKRGVLFADRTDVSVQWIENEIYGKYLMGAFRFDVKQADKNAGFFVTFNTGKATPTA